MTEDTIWANFLCEILLRTCGGSTVEFRAVVGRQ